MNRFTLAPLQDLQRAPTSAQPRADWARAQVLEPIRLTSIQLMIYEFVHRYQQMWGATPFYREIAEACGLANRSAVQYQITRMVKLGLMRKPIRLKRALQLIAIPVKLS